MKKHKTQQKKEYGLLSAHERYKQAGPIQLQNYLKTIEEYAEQGSEYCYLLSSSIYPI